MRLVGRTTRQVASKLDLAAVIARRKELKVKASPAKAGEVPVRKVEQEASVAVDLSTDVVDKESTEKKFSMLLVTKKIYEVGLEEEIEELGRALRPVAMSYNWALVLAAIEMHGMGRWTKLYQALQDVLDIDESDIREMRYQVPQLEAEPEEPYRKVVLNERSNMKLINSYRNAFGEKL